MIFRIVCPSLIGRTQHAGYGCHIYLSDADLTTQKMAATNISNPIYDVPLGKIVFCLKCDIMLALELKIGLSLTRIIDCRSPSTWYQTFLLTVFFSGRDARILMRHSTLDLGNCTVWCSIFNNHLKRVLIAISHPLPLSSFLMHATSFHLC